MMLRNLIFHILIFTFSLATLAQEFPPIEYFSNSAYDAENQNWSIAQDSDKLIYVANNNGLLEFNGARWKLYPSPNKTIIRSVNVIDDVVYTGCYMEFGYWMHDQYGQLVYTSLSDKIKDQLIEDEQFWNIIAIDDWILFQSLNRIYSYNKFDHSFKIIDSETRLTKMVKADGTIYFQKFNDGIYKIVNGKGQLVTNDPIIQNHILVNIFNNNGQLLIQTQNDGFYVLNDNALEEWDTPSKTLLSQISVYNSIKLNNGSFALGTISNGIVFITAQGEIDYSINHSQGISNNTVLSVFEDSDYNIWLGLDNGINCINMNSPFKLFVDVNGNLGTIYTSAKHNNYLYLGTNQGLFYKKIDSADDFQFIEGTKGQVWCLVEHDNTLFCGHNDGTFVVKNNEASLIASAQGTWNIKPIKDVLLQGNYNGLNVLEKQNGSWSLKHKMRGFDISSKYFDFLNDSTLFVNHEYKGVYKLLLNDDLTEVIKYNNDSTIQKGLNSSLIKYESDIFYAYKDGVFKYDIEQSTFKKDSVLSQLYDDTSYITGKLIVDETNRRLWGFSNKNINYVSQGQINNIKKINTISLPHKVSKMMIGYENILHISGEKYLLGTSTGYVIMDLDKIENKEYAISINSIKNYGIKSEKRLIDKSNNEDFEDGFNNMEFTYSIPVYDKFLEAEYQYQLKGLYDEWSEWTNETNILFKNLPHGNYTFNLRARAGNIMTNNTVSYSFTIKKPWYITNLMIVLYTFAILLFSLFMHNVYRTYYRKQKAKLVEKNAQDLELKELENEQQVMQLKNEKLQQDIDNKNRELAISTMSLIKKNEFLNNIKEELKQVDQNKDLKPVIKIIDKNLNNTDDWKFFQEAFNNADKDFLKKIKSKHTNLTPNDLKLCAYLRLNLSSKEIAPLLNISPRSVEVKRYRLRKKMNLPHESSLTNYILEI
ncbi:triple tyrosine motif-containing protein [uncultured Psychroserpens sp.]|uniref:helix-turn-helix and ligand-binding sensor domain-containing protein n=1 Tax=uncultured Psychroserpens sp. TaxID=255436 RepID=UPI002616F025|nr:triple tyrosine motif-containing protein [uncultured Psychroserpens sp.]